MPSTSTNRKKVMMDGD
jgi:hypothetical protein